MDMEIKANIGPTIKGNEIPKKAKESRTVLKMRRKLEHQMKEQPEVTPDTLLKAKQTIEYQLYRHKGERLDLTDKTVTLFDENLHTEQPHSNFIKHLEKTLSEGTTNLPTIKPPLRRGRITRS